MGNVHQVRKFDKQADMYDKKRVRGELAFLRRRLVGSAEGEVLELGVGAGANLPYYRRDVRLNAVDFSPAMLAKAAAANEASYGLAATFIQGDVGSLSLPDQAFDTVVSTLSMCAYDHPERVLSAMNRWCKPGGQILLMEHGISSNKLLAILQKLADPLAYRFVGCHQNRDIMGLISASPLEIKHVEHFMLGMLHIIRCAPTQDSA